MSILLVINSVFDLQNFTNTSLYVLCYLSSKALTDLFCAYVICVYIKQHEQGTQPA